MTEAPRFIVVGIGADGWAGLTSAAQAELSTATTVIGSARQLALLDGHVSAKLTRWRSPMSRHLDEVVQSAASVVHIVASGDPMFHGVGASIVARVGSDAVRVVPTVSSASLAAARMGWDLARTEVVSLVRDSPSTVLAHTDEHLLVLSRDETTPAALAKLLSDNGFGESTLTVLEQVGGPAERRISGTAAGWEHPAGDPLNIVALEVVGPPRVRTPGLPDAAFDNDGQLTKHVIRAVSVCALGPTGGQILWDIGAGSGSIGIEWLRADRASHAVAFEHSSVRADRVAENALRHGVRDRLTVLGGAPESLVSAPDPDAVFIGGGLSRAVFDAAWSRLRSGGRLVVNAVTVENQSLLAELFAAHGGSLTRLGVEQAAPLGSMTTWRPALPIVQWVVDKASADTASTDKASRDRETGQ